MFKILGGLEATGISVDIFLPSGVSASTTHWDIATLLGGEEQTLHTTLIFTLSDDFTIGVHAEDDEGNTADGVISVEVNEYAPIADANGPYSGNPDETVQFDGSGSTDADGNILSYIWDFGDGNMGSGVSPTHAYVDPGNYTVILAVKDAEGAIDVAITKAIINNPPFANFMYIPLKPTDIQIVTFTDLSIDIDGSVVDWNWNFGDGATSTEQNPKHMYDDDGIYTVELTVWDDDDVPDTYSAEIEIFNVPPVADIAPCSCDFGETITFDGSGSYDLDGTIVSYEWTFGDGTTGSGVNPTHYYSDYGSYWVTLIVTDDDGATDQDCRYARVINRESPTTVIIYPEGGETLKGTVTVQWSIHDTQDQHLTDIPAKLYYYAHGSTNIQLITSFTQDKDIDEGSYAWSTTSLPDGSYRLLLVTVDSDGNVGSGETDSFTIANYNAPPTNLPPNTPSRPSGKTSGKAGVEYPYTSLVTDPEGDQVYVLFDWGDTTNSGWLGPYSSGETCTAKHTWVEQDNYQIKVKAKDIYGAESSWSDPLPITMPYSYKPIYQFLNQLFQRFPNLFPLLRQLMG